MSMKFGPASDKKQVALRRAREAVEAGVASFKDAAEHLARAQKRGAKQREMAEAVGKSPAWVNRLLKWRAEGFKDDTPFGPQSKAKRARAAVVQAPKRPHDSVWDEDEKDTSIAVDDDETDKSPDEQETNAGGRRFGQHARRQLVKALNKLESQDAEERSQAARYANSIRAEIGLSWDDLIVPSRAVVKAAA
jgi:hypothetical protein